MKNKFFAVLLKMLSLTQQRVGISILTSIGLALLLLLLANTTNAQANLLEVELEWPNEGETLYAGPSSLLYQVPIKGWINTQTFSPDEIELNLAVFKGSEIIGKLKATPDANGRFEFHVTVNPKGSTEEFTIAFNDCGEQCHSPGDMDLQPGKLQLHVTATDPDGNEAATTRNITVDIAELTIVPVTVLLANDSEQVVENVNVSASTWVYMWRARFGHGITDEAGMTAVQVEALSQSPTEYLFHVEPTVVDGILYEGSEPVTVDLLPGATSAQPITLTVNAYTGTVSGQLSGITDAAQDNLSILAIRLPAGESYQTDPSAQGFFTFSSIPIDQYLFAVVDDKDIKKGLQNQPQQIDLFEDREVMVDIPLTTTTGNHLSGQILSAAYTSLPFAWISLENGGTTSASIDSSFYTLNGLSSKPFSMNVTAPGYYSQKQMVDLSSGSLSDVDLILTQRPETQFLSWGSGAIVLPAGTAADITYDGLILEQGWLWGQNEAEDDPFVIYTPAAKITLEQGRFALAYLPEEQAWLYQLNGRSQIQGNNSSQSIILQPGQMINLLNDEGLQAVAFNPAVIATMNPLSNSPISPTWEPTLSARLRDQLAQIGVNTAQIVTFITYFIVLLSLFIIPLTAVYWQWKRRKTNG